MEYLKIIHLLYLLNVIYILHNMIRLFLYIYDLVEHYEIVVKMVHFFYKKHIVHSIILFYQQLDINFKFIQMITYYYRLINQQQ